MTDFLEEVEAAAGGPCPACGREPEDEDPDRGGGELAALPPRLELRVFGRQEINRNELREAFKEGGFGANEITRRLYQWIIHADPKISLRALELASSWLGLTGAGAGEAVAPRGRTLELPPEFDRLEEALRLIHPGCRQVVLDVMNGKRPTIIVEAEVHVPSQVNPETPA